MKIPIWLLLLPAFLITLCGQAQFPDYTDSIKNIDGLPACNFAIGANISQHGALFNAIVCNPGQLGDWLQLRGKVNISLQYQHSAIQLTEFEKITNQRQFPVSVLTYEDKKGFPVKLSIKLWCPAAVNDVFTTALPIVQTEMLLENLSGAEVQFSINATLDSLLYHGMQPYNGQSISGITSKFAGVFFDMPTVADKQVLSAPIVLKPGEKKTIRFIITTYDADWVTAKQLNSPLQTAKYVIKNWAALYHATTDFDQKLPLTNDSSLNTIFRWYVIPGMLLTKCTSAGNVLTMGYRELNQRDSYFTTWMHLVLFKDAEKKMIQESAAAIQPNGKIPTTILPFIDREDDLDINAFFVLRFFRYVNFYHDAAFASRYWSTVQKAMNWLAFRDSLGEGLPQQKSFWGDWKDVQGVEGRKYSPFASFLYLAALKECAQYAAAVGNNNFSAIYKGLYKNGLALINKPIQQGGLWTGKYYQQVWYDHRDDHKILQDQTVGVFYGLVDSMKAGAIFESLNTNNATPYGIAETFPYYPASFGYNPAEYHNGAVWPWLSFVDIWSRLKQGRRTEAISLLKKVAQADLFASGDFMPNEHINSLTGQNLGFFLQGWNADIFGLYYFGLRGK